MKLLLVTVCAIIAVNGVTAKPNDSLTEEQLKKIGLEFLEQVKKTKEELGKIWDDAKEVVNLKLKQTPEVKKIEKKYIEDMMAGTLDVECAVSVDKLYFGTLNVITAKALGKSLKNITSNENIIENIKEELNVMQTTLEQNLDEEVQKCLNSDDCLDTVNELIEDTEEYFRFVDLTKFQILNHVESEVSSEDVQAIIKTFSDKVPECLTK